MKLFYLLLTTVLLLNCGKKEPILISGSETLHTTVLTLANEFMKTNSNYTIQVLGGGSEEGLQNLKESKTDIAAVSREVSKEELMQLSINKDEIQVTMIAYDGAAIVVHPENSFMNIDLEQAHLIFSKKILNWKELGRADGEIIPVIRNDHSGTATFFKEHVLRKRDLGNEEYLKNNTLDFLKDIKTVKDNFEMADFIQANKNAIGFMGMGGVKENSKKVKVLSYAKRKGDNFVSPTIENVMNRKYKLSRGLYLLYRKSSEKKVNEFISYVLSEKGQNNILSSGYLRSTLPEVEVKAKE